MGTVSLSREAEWLLWKGAFGRDPDGTSELGTNYLAISRRVEGP